MIGKLKGVVDSVEDEALVLDVNGVGYLVSASARTLRAIPAVGEPTELLIETYVREDAIRLYGFLTAGEREWFRLLQSVQGVGAKVALGILGALSAEALSTAVARQDKAMMAARAPGVGPKGSRRAWCSSSSTRRLFWGSPFGGTRTRAATTRPSSRRPPKMRCSPLLASATPRPRPLRLWVEFPLSSDRRPRLPRSSARA